LILDYCHGVTLARALKTQSVSKASVPCIVKNLLQVLHYLHSLRILYRDMKPSNIMLTVGTDRHHPLQVHVVDFGFAVALPDRRQSLRDCHVVGTQGFMAPEIVKEHRYSRASDMFALGKTFACLLEPLDPRWPLLVEACTSENARNRPSAAECLEECILS
jgi:serine/threonine protein kinase